MVGGDPNGRAQNEASLGTLGDRREASRENREHLLDGVIHVRFAHTQAPKHAPYRACVGGDRHTYPSLLERPSVARLLDRLELGGVGCYVTRAGH